MPDTTARAVFASLVFAVKNNPIHIKEKPYDLIYVPEDDRPASNMRYEIKENVLVNDMRDQNLTFYDNGMAIVTLQSQLQYDDYDNKDSIEKIYLKEVRNCLRHVLKTQEIYIFEWMVIYQF